MSQDILTVRYPTCAGRCHPLAHASRPASGTGPWSPACPSHRAGCNASWTVCAPSPILLTNKWKPVNP